MQHIRINIIQQEHSTKYYTKMQINLQGLFQPGQMYIAQTAIWHAYNHIFNSITIIFYFL